VSIGLPGAALLVLTAFVVSAGLSGAARRYALSRSLLDVPNERSLHSVPTPRGGGVAIVVVVVASLALLAAWGVVEARLALALGGGGALVAGVGWLDDRHGVTPRARFAVQVLAAAWAIGWLGGMPELTVGARAVHLGAAGAILAALGIVWLTNLYNFMDGIDGIAATEAIVVGLGGALLVAGVSPPLTLISALVAAAAAGFLVWNRPPARLFMGDVGSGFLGFLFGGLALASERARALPAILWLILLGPFFVDATVTLLRRLARGDRWYEAHRSHAYQRAVQAGWSHGRVTGTVAGLSLIAVAAGWLVDREPAALGLVAVSTVAGLCAVYVAVERWYPMTRRQGQADRKSGSI